MREREKRKKRKKEFSYLTEHKSLVLFPMSARTAEKIKEREKPSSKHEQHMKRNAKCEEKNTEMENEN
jgi:hypothetical protein